MQRIIVVVWLWTMIGFSSDISILDLCLVLPLSNLFPLIVCFLLLKNHRQYHHHQANQTTPLDPSEWLDFYGSLVLADFIYSICEMVGGLDFRFFLFLLTKHYYYRPFLLFHWMCVSARFAAKQYYYYELLIIIISYQKAWTKNHYLSLMIELASILSCSMMMMFVSFSIDYFCFQQSVVFVVSYDPYKTISIIDIIIIVFSHIGSILLEWCV